MHRWQDAVPLMPSAHSRQPALQGTHWPSRVSEKPRSHTAQKVADASDTCRQLDTLAGTHAPGLVVSGYRFCLQRKQLSGPATPSAHSRQPTLQGTHWPAASREKPSAQTLQAVALSQTWQLAEHWVHTLVAGSGK